MEYARKVALDHCFKPKFVQQVLLLQLSPLIIKLKSTTIHIMQRLLQLSPFYQHE